MRIVERFSISNYLNMYKARGIKLVIEYFFYNQLFDFIHSTNTHQWDANFINHKENEHYMATFSKDIKKSSNALIGLIEGKIDDYNLYDLGSGKGKVLIYWNKLFKKHPSITGIEIDKNLYNISLTNLNKLKIKNVEVINKDVNSFKIKTKNNVFFLYNPFGKKVLEKFFLNNKSENDYIIYHNPVHSKLLKRFKFKEIYNSQSYRKGSSFVIMKR